MKRGFKGIKVSFNENNLSDKIEGIANAVVRTQNELKPARQLIPVDILNKMDKIVKKKPKKLKKIKSKIKKQLHLIHGLKESKK